MMSDKQWLLLATTIWTAESITAPYAYQSAICLVMAVIAFALSMRRP